jgi:hypothetical protein
MSKAFFDEIAGSITKDHPSFKIRYKNESRLMRLLAVLAYPFNETFADGYITTLGSTVYFPSRADVEQDYYAAADTLAHEGVHIYDAQKHGIWFTLSYALNQIALLPLMVAFAILGSWMPVAALVGGVVLAFSALWLAMKLTDNRSVRRWTFFVLVGLAGVSYLALSVWMAQWWTVLGVAAFAPLLPVSSLLRAKWEYRGYAMGIAMRYWRTGTVPDSLLEHRVGTFAGPDYYFMDRNRDRVLRKLMKIRGDAYDGSILRQEDSLPYQRTIAVMKNTGLLKSGITGA